MDRRLFILGFGFLLLAGCSAGKKDGAVAGPLGLSLNGGTASTLESGTDLATLVHSSTPLAVKMVIDSFAFGNVAIGRAYYILPGGNVVRLTSNGSTASYALVGQLSSAALQQAQAAVSAVRASASAPQHNTGDCPNNTRATMVQYQVGGTVQADQVWGAGHCLIYSDTSLIQDAFLMMTMLDEVGN